MSTSSTYTTCLFVDEIWYACHVQRNQKDWEWQWCVVSLLRLGIEEILTHTSCSSLIEDEDIKAQVRVGSPKKRWVTLVNCIRDNITCLSSVKVHPPSPGTPEYEELEPVTFAKCVRHSWFYTMFISSFTEIMQPLFIKKRPRVTSGIMFVLLMYIWDLLVSMTQSL